MAGHCLRPGACGAAAGRAAGRAVRLPYRRPRSTRPAHPRLCRRSRLDWNWTERCPWLANARAYLIIGPLHDDEGSVCGMKEYDTRSIRNVALAAHGGTGKTSLTEA